MTHEEMRAYQEDLASRMNLGWWYGVRCEPCEGVFPRLVTQIGGISLDLCRYECPVCGKTTRCAYQTPWLAERAWNEGLFEDQQITFGGI